MIIFPAIDIRAGKCVRLVEGDFSQETVFSDIPAAMARRWEEEGAEYLHVVDLDGAVAGEVKNMESIQEIVYLSHIPVQLGGGIRSMDTIEALLDIGVNRVILGSVAVKSPKLVEMACRAYGDRIVVGIDARDGLVAVEGWGVSGGVEAEELAKRMASVGVERVIFTDISRDGKLAGVNASASASLAKASGLKVIASGGVASLTDIHELKKYAGDGIEGVIAGKALYTGALDLAEAIKCAREV